MNSNLLSTMFGAPFQVTHPGSTGTAIFVGPGTGYSLSGSIVALQSGNGASVVTLDDSLGVVATLLNGGQTFTVQNGGGSSLGMDPVQQGFLVAGVKVLGARVAGPAVADGSLASVTAQFNTLRTILINHGMIS